MKIKSSIKEFIYPPKTVTNSCHASTVLPLSDGSVVAAWFGGTKEGNDDVKIWVSVRDSEKWAEPYSVAVDGEALPHWNPVLFQRENGEIILYFKYGKPIPKWVTYYCISKDGGKSFSKPQVLVPGDDDVFHERHLLRFYFDFTYILILYHILDFPCPPERGKGPACG